MKYLCLQSWLYPKMRYFRLILLFFVVSCQTFFTRHRRHKSQVDKNEVVFCLEKFWQSFIFDEKSTETVVYVVYHEYITTAPQVH